MKTLNTILILGSLATTALAAPVQLLSNLLPAGATPELVKTDSSGNAYVAGADTSAVGDAFVAKISADGSTLIYFSQGGGFPPYPGIFFPGNLAIGPDGSAYVSVISGGVPPYFATTVYKVDPTGATWQTVKGFNWIYDMALDQQGNLYVTGTDAPGIFHGFLPLTVSTPGSLSGKDGSDSFIVKLNAEGTVIYAIHNYGGSNIAVDALGDAFAVSASAPGETTTKGAYQTTAPAGQCNGAPCTGQYVVEIDPTGSQLLLATYLTSGGGETPSGIAVDSAGNVYVAGSTASPDYPTTVGVLEPEFQAQESTPTGSDSRPDSPVAPPTSGYVSALNPTGSTLLFSTYFSGSGSDTITSMSLDETNQILYLAGYATSVDLPGVFGIYRHCVPQAYVTRLAMDGTAVTRTQALAGSTLTLGATVWLIDQNYFAQVDLNAADTPIACLADAAGPMATSAVAAGQLLTIYGDALSAATSAPQPSNGVYPTSGLSASVTVNGIPAPILYESPRQLNVQVPFEVAGQATAEIEVSNFGSDGTAALIDTTIAPLVDAAPSVFETPADSVGCTPAYFGQLVTLAINADGTLNGCGNPAKAGSIVTIFMDGLAVISGAQQTGAVNSDAIPFYLPVVFGGSAAPSVVSAQALVGSISGVAAVQIQVVDSEVYRCFFENVGAGNVQVQVVP
jgi:uncharacterized protein (TIGR03437 family)